MRIITIYLLLMKYHLQTSFLRFSYENGSNSDEYYDDDDVDDDEPTHVANTVVKYSIHEIETMEYNKGFDVDCCFT